MTTRKKKKSPGQSSAAVGSLANPPSPPSKGNILNLLVTFILSEHWSYLCFVIKIPLNINLEEKKKKIPRTHLLIHHQIFSYYLCWRKNQHTGIRGQVFTKLRKVDQACQSIWPVDWQGDKVNVKFEGVSAGVPNIPYRSYRQAIADTEDDKIGLVSRFEIDDRLDQPMRAGSNVKAMNV